jgi:5-methylcytosine-specific restriction endonuclease McrA
MRRACIQGWRGNCSDGGWAVPGTSRCRAHTAKGGWAAYGVKHPERAAAYKDPRWKAMRDAQLAQEPFCAFCGAKATDADHVTPISLGGAFDGPLRSLCRSCHLKATAEASKESKRRAAEARRNQGPWFA